MILKWIGICLCGLIIGSCGFRPLYGNPEELLSETQKVQIEPISGEGGYTVNLILKDRLNPNGVSVSPAYRLTVRLNRPKFYNQSIRSDNFASLEQMDMSADYQLTRLSDGEQVIVSSVNSNGMYNLIKDPYATVMAKDKLYDNLIRLMAEDIATHILSYFKGESQ